MLDISIAREWEEKTGGGPSFPAPKALLDDISGPIFNPRRFDLTLLQCLEKYFFFPLSSPSFFFTLSFISSSFFSLRFSRHGLLLSTLFFFSFPEHMFSYYFRMLDYPMIGKSRMTSDLGGTKSGCFSSQISQLFLGWGLDFWKKELGGGKNWWTKGGKDLINQENGKAEDQRYNLVQGRSSA